MEKMMCEFIIDQIKNNLDNWVLVFVTAILTFFTWMLYKESEKTRRQNMTPQVSIIFTLFPDSHIVYMKISNTGHVDAKNVKIICKNDNYYDYNGKKYKYSEWLSRNFSYLPVEQYFSFLVGYYNVLNSELFEFDLTFQDVSGEINIYYPIRIKIPEMDESLIPHDEVKNINGEIKNIGNTLKYMGNKLGEIAKNITLSNE